MAVSDAVRKNLTLSCWNIITRHGPIQPLEFKFIQVNSS